MSDALDPLRHGSDLQGISSGGVGTNRTSVINNADLKITCSISYADVKMSALAELNSPAEYRTWLLTKVKYMAQQGKLLFMFLAYNSLLSDWIVSFKEWKIDFGVCVKISLALFIALAKEERIGNPRYS